jgi:hypothetical protein
VLAALPELETHDNLRDRLDAPHVRLTAIQAKLAATGWRRMKVRWRQTFARDLRRQVPDAPPGEHHGGDLFLLGFNPATQLAHQRRSRIALPPSNHGVRTHAPWGEGRSS